MKKLFVSLCTMGLILCFAGSVVAGGIENRTNWSAEYTRTFNRNAATDFADVAAYNPAGTVKMAEGWHLNASVQYTGKDYSNTYSGVKYKQDEPSFIPGLFAVYKKEKWSLFGAITNVSGGGEVRFEQGSKTSQQQATALLPLANAFWGATALNGTDLRAKIICLGYTVGAAYAINDIFSVSLGVRYVDARKNTALNAYYDTVALNIDYDETADGWGGIIGLNIAPTDALNIGIRYETQTELNFKTKINNDDIPLGLSGLVDKSTDNRDLPAILGLGVSYKILKDLRAEANFTYYFQESANWEGDEDKVDNGYDVGMTLEYSFGPKFLVSVGYMYTDSGDKPDNMFVENPALKAHSIGGGFAYMPTEKWAINFGIGNVFYKSDTQSDGTKLEKNVLLMGLGVQYKF